LVDPISGLQLKMFGEN